MPWRGLPDSTSLLDASYAKLVLDAVTQESYDPISWVELKTSIPGHAATFLVTADALKIGGVRINVSATLQQQIADGIGALLLTPKLLDQMWAQRAVTLLPSPQPIEATVKSMLAHSSRIDAALAKAGGAPKGGIVQTVGKQWVVSNALLAHSGKAENMGWHFPGKTFDGKSWSASPTLPGIRMIQDPGWAHDASHVDYSQVCCLVNRWCVLDGARTDIATVLQDPTLSALASAEGPLKLLRQPGVPMFACRIPNPTQVASVMSETLCPMPPSPTPVLADARGINWTLVVWGTAALATAAAGVFYALKRG